MRQHAAPGSSGQQKQLETALPEWCVAHVPVALHCPPRVQVLPRPAGVCAGGRLPHPGAFIRLIRLSFSLYRCINCKLCWRARIHVRSLLHAWQEAGPLASDAQQAARPVRSVQHGWRALQCMQASVAAHASIGVLILTPRCSCDCASSPPAVKTFLPHSLPSPLPTGRAGVGFCPQRGSARESAGGAQCRGVGSRGCKGEQ